MSRSVNADDLMTENPVVFKPQTDLFQAINVLLKHKISGATVIDDNRNVVGVISEMDCLKAILSSTYHGTSLSGTVGEFMSKTVDVLPANMDIIDVAKYLIDNNRRRVPIVEDNGKFVGQFSARSILKAVKDFQVTSINSRIANKKTHAVNSASQVTHLKRESTYS
ncbi:MAG: CBS domain-containing protein [Pseudomonadales bacterium]|nr:CBS domain-containing protein [Pseudomonadales bacterium]